MPSSSSRKFEASEPVRNLRNIPSTPSDDGTNTFRARDAIASRGGRSRSCRQDVVETEWRSRAAHARRGKRRYRARRLVNRNGAAASVSSIALGGRPAPGSANFTAHRRPRSGLSLHASTSKFSPLACAREADVRAEHRRRMRSPSPLPLSPFDG